RSVSSSSSKPPSFPWRAMSSSRPAWAVVIGNVGCSTGISVLMSWQPTYFESFLGVDLADLDLVYQLSPYLTMLVFSVLGGVWYSWLISTCDFSKSSASKIVTGVGLFGALVAFLSMTTTTTAAGGTCVTSGVLASLALSRGGWSTNHAEICAPEHGPMLFSVANCVSSITSVVGITITGAMLDNFGGADDVDAWKVAMGVIGGLCGVSGLFYAVFAAGNEVL
ncbi:unnamed protein product, partial [Sphacelaria rigidula]